MTEKEEETQIEIESIPTKEDEYDIANFASAATEKGLTSKTLGSKVDQQQLEVAQNNLDYLPSQGEVVLTTERNLQTERGMIENNQKPETAPTPSNVDPEAPTTEQQTTANSTEKQGETQQEAKEAQSCRLKYPIICVLGIVGLAGVTGLGLELHRRGVFDSNPEEPDAQVFNANQSNMQTLQEPDITIDGPRIRIDWSVDEYVDELTSIDYSVSVLTANGAYEQVWCDNEGTKSGDSQTCELDTVILMSEPYSLYYGDSVSAQILGSSQDGPLMSKVGTSEGVIAPYIAGQIEFGYHQFGYYPFDKVNGIYPTANQLAQLDLNSDLSLTTIRIQERTTTGDHHRLHGIQLGFANGAETPFFKAMDTGEEEKVTTLNVDPTKEISGISMKTWRDTLSGLRLLDADGEYIVDYTWQPLEESGSWSEVQQIPEGQSIIGLMVNEPQQDIFRLAFLLWERYPNLDPDIDLNV